MEKIYLKARAKINLGLNVLNKREDKYHNIKSVFQKINLYDEILIEKNAINEFELKTNIKKINNKENIIYKAYLIIKEKHNNITGIRVILNKKIPMEAGLGGGSTDCACFIKGINKLFDLNLSKTEMEAIGRKLGADVVPCFYDKAVLAEGIGDKITVIDTNVKYYIVIVKPNISCNTKEMYMKIDQRKNVAEIDLSDEIIKGLQQSNIEIIASNLYNSFESIQKDNQLMQNIKKDLIKEGALGSLMTGSGSCIYGIFKDKQRAKSAFNNFKNKYQTFICTSYNSKRSEYFD